MPDFMAMVARARIRTADEDWAAAAELWARAFRHNQDPALDAILAIREYVPG
jgi:hypothetical protein